MTSEEVWRRIIRSQHVRILLSYYGSELLKVTHHQQLYASKWFHWILKATQHGINGIQKVTPYHTNLIDNKQVKRSNDVAFLLRYAILSFDYSVRNVGRERQLKERMNGHSTCIDGCNACRRNHNQALLTLLYNAFKECSLTRSGLTR